LGKAALAPVLLAAFEREKDGDLKVTSFEIVSFKQSYGTGPRLDTEGAAKKEMMALSEKLGQLHSLSSPDQPQK
jgi:hypothetical protein